MTAIACSYCGRHWDHTGRSRSALASRAGKSNAFGFIVAAKRQHESYCKTRTPAQRRAENAKAEKRWASHPPRSRITNDPHHPGVAP